MSKSGSPPKRKRRYKPRRRSRQRPKVVVDGPALSSPQDVSAPRMDELLTQFVSTRKLKEPGKAFDVLCIGMGTLGSWDSFLEGKFLQFAPTEVYVRYEGGGYAAARTLNLFDQLFEWLEAEGHITAWEAARLKHLSDDCRQSYFLQRKNPPAHEKQVYRQPRAFGMTFDDCVAGFARSGHSEHSESRCEPGHGLSLAAYFCELNSGLIMWGNLDAHRFALAMRVNPNDNQPAPLGFVASVLSNVAAFYQWLADDNVLEPSRANEIRQALLHHVRCLQQEEASSAGLKQ